MVAELGHFALIIAFVIAIGQSTAPLIGAQKGWIDWMRLATPAAIAQLVAIAPIRSDRDEPRSRVPELGEHSDAIRTEFNQAKH